MSEESIESARHVMAARLRLELDTFIDDAARQTMALEGYERLSLEEVRPNTARVMSAICESLETGEFDRCGRLLYGVAYDRAKKALPPASLYALSDITEDMLVQLSVRCMSDLPGLLSARFLAREISDGSRRVVIEAFHRAHAELRADADRLMSQFSAPILPALPGVLVLPIVGSVSEARAEEIVQALLAGITEHGARTVILDITGISDVDAALPRHLQRAAATARLLGTKVVLVGVNPEVASTLASSETQGLEGVTVFRTLATALLALGPERGVGGGGAQKKRLRPAGRS